MRVAVFPGVMVVRRDVYPADVGIKRGPYVSHSRHPLRRSRRATWITGRQTVLGLAGCRACDRTLLDGGFSSAGEPRVRRALYLREGSDYGEGLSLHCSSKRRDQRLAPRVKLQRRDSIPGRAVKDGLCSLAVTDGERHVIGVPARIDYRELAVQHASARCALFKQDAVCIDR